MPPSWGVTQFLQSLTCSGDFGHTPAGRHLEGPKRGVVTGACSECCRRRPVPVSLRPSYPALLCSINTYPYIARALGVPSTVVTPKPRHKSQSPLDFTHAAVPLAVLLPRAPAMSQHASRPLWPTLTCDPQAYSLTLDIERTALP